MKKTLHPVLFMRWFAISILTGITIAVAFVVIVDPYNQYGVIVHPAFNLIKPGLTRYQNEIKLTQAVEMRADALILGNSRAEVGFDPDADVFNLRGMSAYNLAIPGTGIGTAREQVEYLHQMGTKPKVIILGVEFLDFVTTPQKVSLATQSVYPIDDGHPVTRWFWRFDSLFSLVSVKDAIRTIFIQHDNEAETMTARSFNPMNQYGSIARREGYYPLFLQRAQENARIYLKKTKGSLALTDFDDLRALLDTAADSGSDVKLIIYPYHAQILALFAETGLWSAFEEWKDTMVREISAARERHPTARIALFDFSGYGSYNCEKIPGKGDHETATRWYWEAGHFKKKLGTVVLDSIFLPTDPLQRVSAETLTASVFGFRLDESNRTLNQQRINLERAQCMRAYPEIFTEVATLVAKARELKSGNVARHELQ